MKKILVINTKYRIFGGEDSNIIDEIKLLKKYFHIEYLEYNNSDNLSLYDVISLLNNSNNASNKRLIEVIKRFKPDVAYVHNTWFKSNLGIFDILKSEGIQTFVKIHNYRFDCSRYRFSSEHLKGSLQCPACGLDREKVGKFNKYYSDSFIKSYFLSRYSRKYLDILKNYPLKVLVLSRFQKKYLINLGIDKDKISIYLNPIEIKEENYKDYEPGSNYVVYAGRVIKDKGVEELLQSWHKVEPKNLTLKIIGSGDISNKLEKKYKYNSIQFLGLLDNNEAKEIIKGSRAVITATKLYEGQPRVLLEASSYGVPSIYPSFGGMDEFFPEDYELSFKQFNYDDLNNKLLALTDQNFLIQESKKVIDFVSANLNEEILINQLNSFINEG